MLRRRQLTLALAASLVVIFSSVRAQGQRSWRLENFETTLEVQQDGSLVITEKLQPRFVGSFNGIFRTIPVDYRTPQGFDYKLFVHLDAVTDESGNKLRCQTSREAHYVKYKIWIPGAQDTVKTVVLRYSVENAIRYFDDHDELYWNATGTEWPVPIDQASALIKLPPAAAGPSLRATAYTGPYGATASEADIEVTGSQISVRTRHGLNFREGLTVVAGWDKGVVAQAGAITLAWRFLRANWMLGFPLVVFAFMFWLWSTRGKDPRLYESVMVLYEPPEKLTPGELGTLVDNKPDLRDITATLVDLAVRGYIRVEEKPGGAFLGHDRDYTFHLLKPKSEWGVLKEHEKSLLVGLFDPRAAREQQFARLGPTYRSLIQGLMPAQPQPRTSVTLSELENSFYAQLSVIREGLFKELIARRYYLEAPEKVKNRYIGWGVLTLLGSTVGLVMLRLSMDASPLPALLAGVSSGMIVLLFGVVMPARTVHGAGIRNQALGFEEFLSRAEKDHLARLVNSPEMFDKYLPYAMALGVEKKWARAFEDIYKQPPDWYRGDYSAGFRPSLLLSNLNAMSTRAAQTFVSTPRSSSEGSGFSSSGSSGFSGGSSGGGFGGGGGGAF